VAATCQPFYVIFNYFAGFAAMTTVLRHPGVWDPGDRVMAAG
jgi:hypothetical protein